MRASKVEGDAAVAEAFDRLTVEPLGDRVVAQQRCAARLDAERPLGPGDLCSLAQALERVSRHLGFAAADGRLDQLWERPDRSMQLILRARAFRVVERRFVVP